jgi:hydrogenase maturation factor
VVNANDLAVRGAAPRWFLATCLLPEGRTTEESVEELFAQLGAACREFGVSLVGGHTEVTHGLDRPLVVGTMLGEVAKDRLVTTSGARPGDALLLTKGVPLEGTSIIARVRAAELRGRGYSESLLARARGYLARLSVVPEARLAVELAPVHASTTRPRARRRAQGWRTPPRSGSRSAERSGPPGPLSAPSSG